MATYTPSQAEIDQSNASRIGNEIYRALQQQRGRLAGQRGFRNNELPEIQPNMSMADAMEARRRMGAMETRFGQRPPQPGAPMPAPVPQTVQAPRLNPGDVQLPKVAMGLDGVRAQPVPPVAPAPPQGQPPVPKAVPASSGNPALDDMTQAPAMDNEYMKNVVRLTKEGALKPSAPQGQVLSMGTPAVSDNGNEKTYTQTNKDGSVTATGANWNPRTMQWDTKNAGTISGTVKFGDKTYTPEQLAKGQVGPEWAGAQQAPGLNQGSTYIRADGSTTSEYGPGVVGVQGAPKPEKGFQFGTPQQQKEWAAAHPELGQAGSPLHTAFLAAAKGGAITPETAGAWLAQNRDSLAGNAPKVPFGLLDNAGAPQSGLNNPTLPQIPGGGVAATPNFTPGLAQNPFPTPDSTPFPSATPPAIASTPAPAGASPLLPPLTSVAPDPMAAPKAILNKPMSAAPKFAQDAAAAGKQKPYDGTYTRTQYDPLDSRLANPGEKQYKVTTHEYHIDSQGNESPGPVVDYSKRGFLGGPTPIPAPAGSTPAGVDYLTVPQTQPKATPLPSDSMLARRPAQPGSTNTATNPPPATPPTSMVDPNDEEAKKRALSAVPPLSRL